MPLTLPVISNATGPGVRLQGIATALGASALALPWLVPTHAAPWTTFHSEILMAVIGLAVAFSLLLTSRQRWELDYLTVVVASVALVPLAQAAAGMFLFPGEAPLVSFYILGFALAIAVGGQSERLRPLVLTDVLFASFVIAGIFSTGIALYQWLTLDNYGVLFAPMIDRPVANVGQPNNLSTLLVWGVIGVWWFRLRRQLNGAVACLIVTFLLAGVALTVSRTGFLGIGLVATVLVVFRRKLEMSCRTSVVLMLVGWFVLCVVLLSTVSRWLLNESLRPLYDLASPRERTMLLRMDFGAIWDRPWFGFGWNQNVTAHVALSDQFPMHGTVGNAHNLVLDLIIWNGVPLGLLLTIGLCLWLWRVTRRVQSAEQIVLITALLVFALHSMLELPHVLAYFLLPVGFMMGALGKLRLLPTAVQLPATGVALFSLGTLAICWFVFRDYQQIEANALAARLHAARIAGAPEPATLRPVVLSALEDGLVTLRTDPHRKMNEDGLKHFRDAVTRYPTVSGLFRYAQASALNGRRQDAEWAMRTLCNLHPPEVCRSATREWQQLAASGASGMTEISLPAADDSASMPLPR